MAVRLTIVCLVLLLAAPPGGLRADDEKEWSKRYDLWLPGTQPTGKGDMRGVVLVRDARTGRPIKGARMRLYVEDLHDLTLTAPFEGTVETDEYGIAVSPGDTFDFHVVVDAPGYAPQGQYGGGFDWIVDLVPGITAQGRLLDTTGKPYAGVPVEYYFGCPHSPAAQRTRTDERGRFEWKDANPDSFFWQPFRWHASEVGLAEFLPLGGRVVTHVVDRGWTARGRVVDPRGRPVAGCVVRSHSREHSRGPAVATDAEGSFNLPGLDPDASLYFFHAKQDAGKTPFHDTSAWHPSVPLTVTMGPAGEPATRHGVHFDPASGDVLAVREVDGRGFRGTGDGSEAVDLSLPEGRYRVFVGRPFEMYETPPITVQVTAKGSETVRPKRKPCPTLRLEFDDRARYERFLGGTLWCDGYAKEIDLLDPEEVRVPGERSVYLVLSDGLLRQALPLEPAEGSQRLVRVRWPRPTKIRLPWKGDIAMSGPDTRVVSEERGKDGSNVLLTYATRPLVLFFDRDEPGDPSRLELDLPKETGREVVVTQDMLKPCVERTFRVLLPDGKPAPGALLDVVGGDGEAYGRVPDLDAEGRGRLHCPQDRPLRYSASLEGFLKMRGRLEESALPTLRFPRGVLDLTVSDPDGKPLDLKLYVDGQLVDGDRPGKLLLRGVPPGLRTLIVGAAGHYGRVMRVEVGADAPRKLEVTLERRPRK